MDYSFDMYKFLGGAVLRGQDVDGRQALQDAASRQMDGLSCIVRIDTARFVRFVGVTMLNHIHNFYN